MTLFPLLSSLAASLAVLSGVRGAAAAPTSKGCGLRQDFAGATREFNMDSGGHRRTYQVHLPAGYDAAKPTPLLLAYHGKGKLVGVFEAETRFSDESVNPDMITVYPVGFNASWQGAPYAAHGVDDVAFSMDLVARLQDQFCVDESRVYATGHSNGAGFCDVLACSAQAGPRFAAFAPISGAFYTAYHSDDECHAASVPLPMLEVHGTGDMQIPYEGRKAGGHGPLLSIPAWVAAWARRNGCDAPETSDSGHGIHDSRYQCRGVADALEHIKVDGMGHAWPLPGSRLGDVSTRVLAFLRKHRRPQ
ncbi:hypothetical protein E4U42_000297 [Claviceps africana]|uniref:feruloyl esterase n=1 Tax=Claviceps africana TaxID=83212 RepID=A0A8K0J2P7_9HYPO|nr:hypothetical protein E4U42_000297 [Claviceps africana]